MATVSLATAPPPRHLGTPGGHNQVLKLYHRLEGTRLARTLNSMFLPMIIDEDSFRPAEFVIHEDPLDYHAALAIEFSRHDAIVAQVTPFTSASDLHRRVLRARQQGIHRMVFVGVPREFDESEVIGLYPDQALEYFAEMMPERGVITIPVRSYEQDRLIAKVHAGASFVVTQLLYGDAIVEVIRGMLEAVEEPPEIILSFGYIPAIEADHGLIQWLIQDPNADQEMEWVKAAAACSLAERKRRLIEIYEDIVGAVRNLGVTPGINFEAPYGLSHGAIDAFEAMLDIYDPRTAPP